MSKHLAKPCLAAGVVLLLGTFPACGTRKYNERLEETVKRLEQGSVFGEMYPPAKLPDTPPGTSVMVQLPRFFEEGPLPEESDPRRLKPGLAEDSDFVSSLKRTYEGFIVDSDGGKQSFYCYLAVIDLSREIARQSENPVRKALRRLQTRILEVCPDASGRWPTIPCETPVGLARDWKTMHGTGEQEFYYLDKDGKETFVSLGGTMEFYARREGNLLIVIGWRLPTIIENLIGRGGDFGLDKWAPRVAGSVTVE